MVDDERSHDDAPVPTAAAEEEWHAVDEDVGLREEPWWEVEGAPTPRPGDVRWHEREGPHDTPAEHLPSSARGGEPSDRSAERSWRSLDQTERVALLAILGVLLTLLILGVTSVWLLGSPVG